MAVTPWVALSDLFNASDALRREASDAPKYIINAYSVMSPLLCWWLYFLVAVVSGENCDLSQLESLSGTLKYDAASLNQYQQIMAQLKRCTTEYDSEERQKSALLSRLYYRAGIIQLSLNQGLNAIDSFEHVEQGADPFHQLAGNRLRKLYVEFGLWDKLDSTDEVRQNFMSLDDSVRSKWEADHDYSKIENDLQEMLEISPSSLETRTLFLEVLSFRLAEDINVAVGYEMMRNYERLLETHGARFALQKRLRMYHSLAVIQAFILNTEPTHLRKCLALDMDYEPCRKLTLLNNKLSKVNPPRSEILDPEVYAFGDNSNFDWLKLKHFYLNDKRPCIRVAGHFKNNYELIMSEVAESIESLLPPDFALERPCSTEFTKFIHTVLCQTSAESIAYRLSTQKFCDRAMEEVVPKEVVEYMHRSSVKDDIGLERILTETWQSYPHLAIHMIQIILEPRRSISSSVEDKIHQFLRNHGLNKSPNKLIQNQDKKVSDRIRIRRQKDQRYQQRHHQKQQQQWFQNQQRQHQRQHAAPPNAPRTDRDYYKILGIPKSATSKEIRRAYLDFTKKYHPDKQGQLSEEEENKIHEKMSMINEAYETLNDDQKRKEYDQARSGTRKGPMFQHNAARGGSSNFGSNFEMNFKPNFKFQFM